MKDEPLFPFLEAWPCFYNADGVGLSAYIAGAGCELDCRYCKYRGLLGRSPEYLTAGEVIDELDVAGIMEVWKGGVVFGGGEPLLHADFLRRFRELAPREWHLTIETSLAVPRENLLRVIDAADLFVVDCKSMDGRIYRRYTGVSADLMKDNLSYLFGHIDPARVLVRVPRLPGYSTEKDQEASVEKLRALGATNLLLFSVNESDDA